MNGTSKNRPIFDLLLPTPILPFRTGQQLNIILLDFHTGNVNKTRGIIPIGSERVFRIRLSIFASQFPSIASANSYALLATNFCDPTFVVILVFSSGMIGNEVLKEMGMNSVLFGLFRNWWTQIYFYFLGFWD